MSGSASIGGWRFLNTGRRDGAWNMAVDEALLVGVNRSESAPTVRVYAWDPPTVSTGYSQDLEDELDLSACRDAGFGVVRRPTGGRAVLHAGELTYSVVGPAGAPPLGGTIMEAYKAIADALVRGLRSLGVDADLARVATEARARGGVSPPCFVSAGRFEVVVGGKKLIGSAQRRVGRGVLQHGSLLIDRTHERLADVLSLESERDRAVVRRALASKTTDLVDVLGREVTFGEVASAMRSGFERAWSVEFDECGLTERESELASELTSSYNVER